MSTSLTDKTLVLDIDECCVHTHTDDDIEDIDVMTPENIAIRSRYFEVSFEDIDDIGSIWGVKRPYLDQFLSFAGRYFHRVIVWSAGEKEYVLRVVKEIFKDHKQPDLILTRENCVGASPHYHKPLSELKKYIPNINLETVIAIDDRSTNFKNNPGNGITIPEFNPTPADSFSKEDHCLVNIINWLLSPSVLNSTCITKLDKTKIFSSIRPSIDEKYTRYAHHCCFGPLNHL